MIKPRPDLQVDVPVAKGVFVVGVQLRHGREEDLDARRSRGFVDDATASVGNHAVIVCASRVQRVLAVAERQLVGGQPDHPVSSSSVCPPENSMMLFSWPTRPG